MDIRNIDLSKTVYGKKIILREWRKLFLEMLYEQIDIAQ